MPNTKTSRMSPVLIAQMKGQISAAEPSAPTRKTGLRPMRSPSSAHAGMAASATRLAAMIIHSRPLWDRPIVFTP